MAPCSSYHRVLYSPPYYFIFLTGLGRRVAEQEPPFLTKTRDSKNYCNSVKNLNHQDLRHKTKLKKFLPIGNIVHMENTRNINKNNCAARQNKQETLHMTDTEENTRNTFSRLLNDSAFSRLLNKFLPAFCSSLSHEVFYYLQMIRSACKYFARFVSHRNQFSRLTLLINSNQT